MNVEHPFITDVRYIRVNVFSRKHATYKNRIWLHKGFYIGFFFNFKQLNNYNRYLLPKHL
jgi:hypothetical protein